MKNVLITGGGGFIGKALVLELVRNGYNCGVIGRSNYPDLQKRGVCLHKGDLADEEHVKRVMGDGFIGGDQQEYRGEYDTVFHVASLTGIWGGYTGYYQTNVVGTRNLISACLGNNVRRFIYTSTPSVVFNKKDIIEGDETLPYPENFLCSYAKTKAIAEKTVLGVDQEKCRTCAIRPHLVWGPGDPHLVPRLLERARIGKLQKVGQSRNMVDITYIDNVVYAHILAAKELCGEGKCAGKAYFIGQEEPVNLWAWIDDLLRRTDHRPIEKTVSFQAAYSVGALLEMLYTLSGKGEKEPRMTRFLACQLAKSHYFSHKRAEADFGYTPRISTEEGMECLLRWLNNEKIM